MSLSEDIIDNISGYSKAMYSTWFYYRSARLLLDAGEGVSTALENFVFGIENIFLGHGHHDHVGGVPGILHARASARGDKEKPLSIYYPQGDSLIESLRRYTDSVTYRLSYDLQWSPLEDGQMITLADNRDPLSIQAFRTRHTRKGLSLGYKIVERRTRLKPEFADVDQERIVQLVRENGREAISEPYDKVLLAYSGDSMPVDPDQVRDAEVLMHDTTFVDRADREDETHATLEEAVEVARDANVAALVCFHLSSRYAKRDLVKKLKQLVSTRKAELAIYFVISRHVNRFKHEKG